MTVEQHDLGIGHDWGQITQQPGDVGQRGVRGRRGGYRERSRRRADGRR